MGLQIDGELRYAEDALITAEKATSISVAHSSFMHNISGFRDPTGSKTFESISVEPFG